MITNEQRVETIIIDDDIEELNEGRLLLSETLTDIEKVENTEATLESLITSLESIYSPNLDTLRIANVALESRAMMIGVPLDYISVSLEDDNESKAEQAKDGILAKAKGFLNSIKDKVTGLVAKMLLTASSLLSTLSGLVTKIKQKAIKLKEQVRNSNSDFKGNVKIKPSVGKYLTINGKVLKPSQYVSEFFNSKKTIEILVKQMGTSEIVNKFMNNVKASLADGKTDIDMKQLDQFNLNVLNMCKNNIDKSPLKYNESFEEAKASNAMLGGVRIYSVSLTDKSIQEVINLIDQKVDELANQQAAQQKSKKVSNESFYNVSLEESPMARQARLDDEKLADRHMRAGIFSARLMGYFMVAGGVATLIGSAFVLSLTSPWIALAVAVTGIGTSVLGNRLVETNVRFADKYNEQQSLESEAINVVKPEMLKAGTAKFLVKEAKYESETVYETLSKNDSIKVIDGIIESCDLILGYGKNSEARKVQAKQFNDIVKTLTSKAKENNAMSKQAIKNAKSFCHSWLKTATKLEIDLLSELAKMIKSGMIYVEKGIEKSSSNNDTKGG